MRRPGIFYFAKKGREMRERLHLDRRASLLAKVGEEGGSGDDLLNTTQVAEWLTVSTQWVAIGRNNGYGPPFVKLGGKVRYLRSDVKLAQRADASLYQRVSAD